MKQELFIYSPSTRMPDRFRETWVVVIWESMAANRMVTLLPFNKKALTFSLSSAKYGFRIRKLHNKPAKQMTIFPSPGNILPIK